MHHAAREAATGRYTLRVQPCNISCYGHVCYNCYAAALSSLTNSQPMHVTKCRIAGGLHASILYAKGIAGLNFSAAPFPPPSGPSPA